MRRRLWCRLREASDEQISKLPPILIVGAERDILYDQGKEFAARLKGKGNDAEHITFPGACASLYHGGGAADCF